MEAIEMEYCKNPHNNTCTSENIKLYIVVEGEKLPICNQCWKNIASSEKEW